MKKQRIALLGGAALVVAFLVAAYVYKGQRAEETKSMAKTSDSPLARSYAQSIGPADAKVVIVEFFDPGCETCRLIAPHVKALLNAHPGKIRLVLRYAPFHQGADTMVKILEAARRQGRYWETLDVMFETQAQWADHHAPDPDKIWQFLPHAGVSIEEIQRVMEDPEILAIVEQDMADAKALGVHRTPEFFVNGKPLPSFGVQQLQTLVRAEIAANYR